MVKVDWKKEIDARKDDLFSDLSDLLRIDSVRDVEHKTADMPLGPGPAKALHKFLEIGERDGFTTKNIENVAGHIEFGEGDEVLGVLGHVDVVPVGDGWDTDPFEPVRKDGKLFARGSSDDKGPAVAAYYGMKLIKELNLPISKKVRFIIGTDEESGWYCMDRYMAVEKMPDFGFSPDAHFPIINGEKGIATIDVTFNLPKLDNNTFILDTFESGLRSNMVPGDATATLRAKDNDFSSIASSYPTYLKENDLHGSIDEKTGTIHLIGKAAHAQNPKAGVNAATYLAAYLMNLDLDTSGKEFTNILGNHMHKDSEGKLLNINHTDDVMGELTSSANIVSYTNGGKQVVSINIRYPKGTDATTIIQRISETIPNTVVTAQEGVKTPHYVPADDELVTTLLSVYEDHTGEKGFEKTIGGGTYGRLFERGVAYGALFPGREDVMHQANEYMYEEDIYKAAAIYADAIYRLIK